VDVDILRPDELRPDALAKWLDLQHRGPRWDSPFLSPYWPRAVERARRGRDVKIAVLSRAGEPLAFMPVGVGQVTAMAAGGALADYEGLVGEPEPGFDPIDIVRALGVDRYDFSHVPSDQTAFAPYMRGSSVSWIVDVGNGYEAYASERSGAKVSALKKLDRKRRKAGQQMGQARFTARSTSRAAFARLIELKRAQFAATGQTDIFAAGWPLRLVEQLFETKTTGFGGVLFTLHIGDQLAAAQFDLVGGKTVHAWIIAHEPAFERFSPGLLLFQDILRWMDDEPYERLDLGYGDYRFKRELANTQRPLSHGFVGAPSAASLVREAAYRVRNAAEALPLGPVSDLPGKAMRRIDLLRGLR
jgi:CelD/BcsL family acetyltransferase involved in cellulose biosynthesis